MKAEEENGTPVNVSMECLSAETLGKSLPYMARDGYWIVIFTLKKDDCIALHDRCKSKRQPTEEQKAV